MREADVGGNIRNELRKLLKAYRPSQLDEQLTTACPFYEPENRELTSAYRLIHDMAKSKILVKLQMKLDEISVVSELPLEFGRVDGAAGNEIVLTSKDSDIFLFIEIKTGNVKLVQPAIYTILRGTKTLVAELRTGDILTINVSLAEKIVEELLEHMKAKEILKESGKKIPGLECRYCGADCEFRENVKWKWSVDPLKSLPDILGNVDTVVDKIAAEIAREIQNRSKRVCEAEA